MPSLWDYVQEYPGRLRDQFNQGMQQFAATRNPVTALGAINPTTPFIQDAALQAGGLIAPQTNQLSQAVSQASENLGLGPLSIPEVTDEQLAPFLMLGMGSPSKMGFYSPSGKALTTAPGKGTSQQYLAHLKKEPGATREAKQTGLIQRLEEAPGTLTQEEVVSMWNPIELTETVKTAVDTKGAVNLDSPFAIPEVMRAARNAVNADDLALTIANDGDAYRALERQFPNLTDQDDWDEIVVRDIWGRQDQPANVTRYGNDERLNLPGGEGPKEILVQLPVRPMSIEDYESQLAAQRPGLLPREDVLERYQNYLQDFEAGIGPVGPGANYESTHWDEPNVLAHIRTNKRDVGGVSALHAEEFQSDWHQQGQKKGYVDVEQKRVLENRLTEIQEAIKASNQQIAGNDDVGLLKKLDGDTSGLNVMVYEHPEGGTNFSDRNQTVAPAWGAASPGGEYAFIGHIDRNGKLSTTKYTTPEQKILLEKQAELVRERNSIRNDLRPMSLSSGKVPDAPFKKDWHELSFKRFLMEGINDPSVDRITWTSGAVQADRYNLAKQIDELFVGYGIPGSVNISGTKDGDSVLSNSNVQLSQLDDYVGKEIADRIRKHIDDNPPSTAVKDAEKRIAEIKAATGGNITGQGTPDQIREWSELNMFIGGAAPNSLTLSGVDLEVGGEFHKNLYDKKIPQFAKKFLKKYGVEPKKVPSAEMQIIEGELGPSRKIRPELLYEIWTEFPEDFVKAFETREEAEKFIERNQENLWYIDITPEMRQDLQEKGVPLAMNDRKPLLAYA